MTHFASLTGKVGSANAENASKMASQEKTHPVEYWTKETVTTSLAEKLFFSTEYSGASMEHFFHGDSDDYLENHQAVSNYDNQQNGFRQIAFKSNFVKEKYRVKCKYNSLRLKR